MKHTMRRPCEHCPFIKGGLVTLPLPTLRRIIAYALIGNHFPCHLTVDCDERREASTNEEQCAGAEISAVKWGRSVTTLRQLKQRMTNDFVAELDMRSNTYESPDQMITQMR